MTCAFPGCTRPVRSDNRHGYCRKHRQIGRVLLEVREDASERKPRTDAQQEARERAPWRKP